MLQAPLKAVGILILNFFEPDQTLRLSLFQDSGSSGRHDGDGYDERGHQAVADAHGHGLQQAAHRAGGEHHRQEDADRSKGRGHDRHAHLTSALHGGAGRRYAPAPQTVDVLDDDDRVIHQHTDTQRQARQRHDVHVEAGEVHQNDGEQDGQRDADADHEGGLDVLQEDGQHDDGQRSAHQHTADDAVDDDGDVVALIGQDDDVKVRILSLQLLEGIQAAVRDAAGAGIGVAENFQHHGPLPVQAGIAGLGVVDDGHVGHIGEADIAEAIDVEQKCALDVRNAVVLFADLQQPGLAALIGDVAGRHREVLSVDELGEGLDVQLLGHIGAGKGLFLALLVELLGVFQLVLIVLEHLAGLGKTHIGAELLAGIAAQSDGELVHQAGDIVHGFDDLVQSLINGAQAVGDFQLVGKVGDGAVAGSQTALQLLQSGGELIGDVAQLADDLDEGVDVPHTGLVELVHDPLQAVADVDEGLLDLRLIDHADELVDAAQQSLRLVAHDGDGVGHLRTHLGHDGVRDRVAKVFQLFFVLGAALGDLGLGVIELGAGIGQLGVDEFQQAGVHFVYLILIQLHLHHLFDEAVGRHAGNAAGAAHIRHEGVIHKIRQIVDIAALPADSHRHKGVHVQAVLDDGGGQTGAGQTGRGLVHLVGGLDHRAVHVGAFGEFHEQKAVVFCRGRRDALDAGHCTQRVLHHIGDF